jgi:hypothetical protein
LKPHLLYSSYGTEAKAVTAPILRQLLHRYYGSYCTQITPVTAQRLRLLLNWG